MFRLTSNDSLACCTFSIFFSKHLFQHAVVCSRLQEQATAASPAASPARRNNNGSGSQATDGVFWEGLVNISSEYCEDNAKIQFIKSYCISCNKFEEACACQTSDIVPGCQPLVVCSTMASGQDEQPNEFLAKLKPNVTELLTKKTSEQLAEPFFREGAHPQDQAETIKQIVSSTASTIYATVRFHVNMQKKTPTYGEVQTSKIKKNLPPTVTALTHVMLRERALTHSRQLGRYHNGTDS